ncbi:MAG: hypothetical protein MJ174_08115 [Treponema sp.]|nr:hypothetical protein [Treponema sp.]
MSEEKNGWVQSSIGNKIGTILWAVAGLIYLVISLRFLLENSMIKKRILLQHGFNPLVI